MNKINKHREIVKQLHKTYQAKNADYGDSFSKTFQRYGMTAAMCRMYDKWNRLEQLAIGKATPQVANESIQDTLLDLANYCILTIMELDEKKLNTPPCKPREREYGKEEVESWLL